MNPAPFRKSQAGFGSVEVKTDRDNEYDAFATVTRMLQKSSLENDRFGVILAIQKNIDLWTLVASDLSHPDNKLSNEVKAGLLSLSFFSIQHGHKVLISAETSDALIDINTRVMKGLRGELS